VVLVATVIFSGISGANVADIAAVGTALKRHTCCGYDGCEAAAVLAALFVGVAACRRR